MKRPQLSRLREIGWSLWDPIGLAGVPHAVDEYDAYLLDIASRLCRNEPPEACIAILEQIETVHMGLTHRPDTAARAQSTVEAIRAYLSTLSG